ncbi:hypothetical protein AB4238_20520 [Shewanella sp. 10N.286.45.A1]|uniref:DUF4124 domain-containing protein n=1 Tax=Shewanella sp. 10N.286.45.A1 TaxID=3229694 RepID=UPI003554401A
MNKGLFFILALCSSNLEAAVYKCTLNGVETYSQDPCAEDAQEITVTPPAKMNRNSNSSTEEKLVQQCMTAIKRNNNFKDPESVQVLGYRLDWLQDDSGARRVLQLEVNAKNSYGGYGGSKLYPCYLNHSGTQLSKHQYKIFQ